MSGQDGGFPQAAARFSAEVEHAVTRARRAAREAKAESAEFRKRTEELSGQAKNGRLRGLRRGQVAPTTPAAREDATTFRVDNGLPVDDLPAADALIARLPNREPAPTVENDDFSQHQVMFDVDEHAAEPEPTEPVSEERIDSPEPVDTAASDAEEDFSQQRILFDVTVESYRPEETPAAVFEPSEPENRR
jgi:hypothetical protein